MLNTCTCPMATKYGKVMIHREGLPFKRVFYKRSNWQTKIITPSLSQCSGHKTYQGGGILQGAPTHKFA